MTVNNGGIVTLPLLPIFAAPEPEIAESPFFVEFPDVVPEVVPRVLGYQQERDWSQGGVDHGRVIEIFLVGDVVGGGCCFHVLCRVMTRQRSHVAVIIMLFVVGIVLVFHGSNIFCRLVPSMYRYTALHVCYVYCSWPKCLWCRPPA